MITAVEDCFHVSGVLYQHGGLGLQVTEFLIQTGFNNRGL